MLTDANTGERIVHMVLCIERRITRVAVTSLRQPLFFIYRNLTISDIGCYIEGIIVGSCLIGGHIPYAF